jgi:hypothetical protein
MSVLFCCYQLLSQQNPNETKTDKTFEIFEKRSTLTKILMDWREVLTKPITKIVVPNQFPGFLLYVDNLARVLAT